MIHWFIPYQKIVPDEYVSTIFDIDYTKLYAMGKRLILTDLDNTLISYIKTKPTEELLKWKEMVLGLGFEIVIISNSRKTRVSEFANELGLPFVKFAKKPLKGGFKKALKKASRKYKKDEVVELGDQLMTDVYGTKRMKFYSILVKAIDKKTEKWVTKCNRHLEIKMLKKCKKKNLALYEAKLEKYAKENIW